VGAWTKRSTRGTITGIWATCGNVGNIIGLQLAAHILEKHEQDWDRLMFLIAIIYVCLALIIGLTYVAEPREVGIDMTDDHQTVSQNQ